MNKHEDRRDKLQSMTESQFRDFVFEQSRIYESQFKEHRELLAQNTALTVEIAASTKEIVAAFNFTKSGAHFLSLMGRGLSKFAKIMLPIVTLAGVLWALSHGQWPKGGE